MQNKKGKIKVLKEERKKFVLNEIEKIDKNKEVEKIIVLENENKEKEKKVFQLINNDLNEQENNFKKRLEVKKEKIKLNKFDFSNFENKIKENKRK